jgi:RNA polymerase sigma factor (sigma-70 family)
MSSVAEEDFRRLVEPHRAELHAHCYRMLGSVHDADDALQDALLRAWRGLARFEGRSSLRSWLYRIATNTSLDVIARRPQRVLPLDHGPAGDPLVEPLWIGPYPDDAVEDGFAAPDARYERRESVELAQQASGAEYNFRHVDDPGDELPGLSAFALEDGVVYRTYSAYARGLDIIDNVYQLLDRAPKGRDEADGDDWIRRHDEY